MMWGSGPEGDGRRLPGTGKDCEHGDDHHSGQGISLIDGQAGVLQFLDMGHDLVQSDPIRSAELPLSFTLRGPLHK